MPEAKADIITRLQKEIISLQSGKHAPNSHAIDTGLGKIRWAFPNAEFPVGAMHEFICPGPESSAATGGFISCIVSSLMHNGGPSLWIGPSSTIFAPSLRHFGIEPNKMIFACLRKQKDILWCMEEALKCNGLVSVIGEINELDLTSSRRLQLAVEQSGVTGFVLRTHRNNLSTTAFVTRWSITSLPSIRDDEMPGVGFPRWNVELLKVRNGKPGTWQVEWANGRLRHTPAITSVLAGQHKQTG